ncbi:MAG: hypothetical protein A2W91_12370 [Bacteroidetes bacterium GWF2_38_335]|nr:MAG: hypothetical protein A2W91_12370 [Bacteroidetes bacterium GWF2_38_335]OFY76963.1 MAG: hypothetical protein A2281_00485 [Bacteroidetes bacterium RIFOXYA12_FULL_38_20]HBS86818.1 hypothetical protein [Bacteroidales bacterium]
MNRFKLTLVFLTVLSFAFGQNARFPYAAEEDGYFTGLSQSMNGLVFTDNYASKLYMLQNGALKKITASAGCGRYYEMSPDGKMLGFKKITETGMQIPTVFDFLTNKLVELHAPAEKCGQVSFSADGHMAFTVENTLFVKSQSETKTYDLGCYVNIVKISSDGNYVSYADNNNQIHILFFDIMEDRIITSGDQNYAYPQFSANGSHLLYQGDHIYVYDLLYQQTYDLGPGLAPKFSADEDFVIFHKIISNEQTFIGSDLFVKKFDNSFEKQLTFTPDVYEMGANFIGWNKIAWHTYSGKQIVSSFYDKNSWELNPVVEYAHSGKIEIEFYDSKNYYHNASKGVVQLGPAPYVNQVYDTPDWHNGHGSCKPTTAVMAAAFYNRLPEWPTITNNESATHYNSYGSYVADKYRYDELFFNVYEAAYSTDAWGAYGYMWGTGTPTGSMQEYLEHHGMVSNTIWTSSNSYHYTKDEIDLGYPHPICSYITSVGHVKLAIGYIEGLHSIMFNDPYGNKNLPGYPNPYGAGAIYDWPGYNNGYVNLDVDGSHGVIAWSTRARSTQPNYSNLVIDDDHFGHGFYVENTISTLGGGYNIQQYYRDQNTGYNGHSWWTITESTGVDICFVNWTPTITEPGNYKIEVYIPATNATATTAPYKIYYSGGNTTVSVNQNIYSDQWVDLGTYFFDAGTTGYVHLGDMTGITGQSLAFDAMRWTKITSPVSLTATNISCFGQNDGSISAGLAGGTPPISYLWNNAATSSSITGLEPGVYTVTVTDAVDSYIASTTISEPAEINANVSVTPPTAPGLSDGSAQVSVTGGVPAYTYLWTPGGLGTDTQTGLPTGTYSVLIQDVNGCEKEINFTVSDPTCLIPTGLTTTAITQSEATLNWNAISGALGYAVKVTEEGWPISWEYFSADNSLNISGLCLGTDYTWEVATICDNDSSVWVSSTFTTSATLSNYGSTDCSGIFTDAGGSTHHYGNSQDFVFTLTPTGATEITMIFDAFDLEPGSGATCDYDYLKIYDGPSTSSTLLGTYCNTTGSPGTILSSGGSLTFQFHSDGSTVRPGWVARWMSDGTGCGNPATLVDEPATEWQTEDFSATFTDTDVNSYGLNQRFYQVLDFNGTSWWSNTDKGFLADDFSSTLNPEWVSSSGTWSVTGGNLYQSNQSVSNTNLYIPIEQSNEYAYLYQFKMQIIGGDATRRAGLHIFCDDPTLTERGNSYLAWFRIAEGEMQLWKNVDNVDYLETTGTVPLANGTWYDVKMLFNPDSLYGEFTVFVNDQKIVSWVDHNPHTTANSISLRTRLCSAYFDDIKVYKSRPGTKWIEIGSSTDDIRYQNPNPATPSAVLSTLVVDNFDRFSVEMNHPFNIDWTPPASITTINDGLTADEDLTSSTNELSANWTGSTDVNSDIADYWYAIGTTSGGNDLVDWTSNGTTTNFTATGLSLVNGQTYYISVKAENGAGLYSGVTTSDGITAEYSVVSASFSTPFTDICEDSEIDFLNNSSNADSYLWIFEGGTPATTTDPEPTVTWAEPGDYDVTLIAYHGIDSDTLTIENYVIMHAAPVAGFTVNSDTLYIPGATATFTNTSENANLFHWHFGNGDSSNDINPYCIYDAEGVYTITLVSWNSYCDPDTLVMEDYIVVLNSISITETAANSALTVYPNPGNGEFVVEMKGIEASRLEITDLTGKTIKTILIPNPQQQLKVDLSKAEKGIYFFKIYTRDEGYFVKKILLVE